MIERSASRSEEELRSTAESLAVATAAKLSGSSTEVALVLSDRADRTLLAELGRALETCGIALSAVAIRRAVARSLVQSLADIEIESAWLLDVRSEGFALVSLETGRIVPISLDMAQLVENRLTAVVDAATAGEGIRVEVERVRTGVAISATRPMATAQLSDAQLFDPSFSTGAEGEDSKLGLGFALRLVRGLAKLAGGDLRVSGSDLVLTLPRA